MMEDRAGRRAVIVEEVPSSRNIARSPIVVLILSIPGTELTSEPEVQAHESALFLVDSCIFFVLLINIR